MKDAAESALAEALERAQADERLPEWTMVRDLGWWQPDEYVIGLWTGYAPPLIDDGRDHDHLWTSVSATDLGAAAKAIERLIERHLEEWRFLVEHTGAEPAECPKFQRYERPS